MSITLDGTNGITTPDLEPTGSTAPTNGVFLPAANSVGLATNSTEHMRIDAGGNVGIGTSSPSAKLMVYGSSGTSISLNNSSTGVTAGSGFQLQVGDTADAYVWNYSNGPTVFATNNTERARIDSSGNLLVGTTSAAPGYGNTNTGVQISGSGSNFSRAAIDYVMTCNQNTADGSNYYQMVFRVANVIKGSIVSTSTATSYGTSSDYRLKNTIAPMTGALDKVALLKPCTYKWIVDGSDGQGFIAHELAEVEPGCVTGEKDAVDAEGKPKYQGIDTSFLVATLTAAIQEQQALIQSLTARITALETT